MSGGNKMDLLEGKCQEMGRGELKWEFLRNCNGFFFGMSHDR